MYYIVVIGLLLVGMILGLNIQASSSFINTLNSLTGLISAIATIFATYVGYRALSQWRTQFNHQKKFDAFEKLRDTAIDWIEYVDTALHTRIEAVNNDIPIPRSDIQTTEQYLAIKKAYRIKAKLASSIEPNLDSNSKCDFYDVSSKFRGFINQIELIVNSISTSNSPLSSSEVNERNNRVNAVMDIMKLYYDYTNELETELANFQNGTNRL